MVDRAPRATDTDGLSLGDLLPGARVGEYVIEHKLATRGTGHVYGAIHLVLPRRVTIKVMPAAQAWARSVALELLREACIVDALDHPGIPRVYECGMLAEAGGRGPRRKARRRLEPRDDPRVPLGRSAPEAAAIVRDVAAILEHVHDRGLIHSPTSRLPRS